MNQDRHAEPSPILTPGRIQVGYHIPPPPPPERPPRIMRFQELRYLAAVGKLWTPDDNPTLFQVVGTPILLAVLSSGAIRLTLTKERYALTTFTQELMRQYDTKNPWVVETELLLCGDEIELPRNNAITSGPFYLEEQVQ